MSSKCLYVAVLYSVSAAGVLSPSAIYEYGAQCHSQNRDKVRDGAFANHPLRVLGRIQNGPMCNVYVTDSPLLLYAIIPSPLVLSVRPA